MSKIVSTPEGICNSPLNHSPAKSLWTFPKAPKFGFELKPICNQICYDLPPVKSTRSPGFGYGTKYDFTKTSLNNPAPNAYKTETADGKNKKRGFSFGLSREAMAVTGSQYVGDKFSPGPGAYDTREINKTIISFTFKGKTASQEALSTSTKVPGPGAYTIEPAINQKGSYFVSKYKNSGASTISPFRTPSMRTTRDLKPPGPGTYDVGTTLTPKGSCFVSKFQSSMARSFGRSLRGSSTQRSLHDAPGPGSYRLPSEFGYYENAAQTDRPHIDSAATTARGAGEEAKK